MLQLRNESDPESPEPWTSSAEQLPPPWPGHFVDLPSGKLYVRTAPLEVRTAPLAADPGPTPRRRGGWLPRVRPAAAPAGSAASPQSTGFGEPALFIHGLGGSSTNWTDLMDLLSRPADSAPAVPVLECTAIDLPGFGCSPPPVDGGYSISSHASAVIELIERQGRGPVHLIGNSMGGAVSTRVAARRPDLVRSLILISPALPDLRPRPLPL